MNVINSYHHLKISLLLWGKIEIFFFHVSAKNISFQIPATNDTYQIFLRPNYQSYSVHNFYFL